MQGVGRLTSYILFAAANTVDLSIVILLNGDCRLVRAFDQDVDFALGSSADRADGETVRVPVGEGRRLVGRHFFARATGPGPCRITQRGV